MTSITGVAAPVPAAPAPAAGGSAPTTDDDFADLVAAMAAEQVASHGSARQPNPGICQDPAGDPPTAGDAGAAAACMLPSAVLAGVLLMGAPGLAASGTAAGAPAPAAPGPAGVLPPAAGPLGAAPVATGPQGSPAATTPGTSRDAASGPTSKAEPTPIGGDGVSVPDPTGAAAPTPVGGDAAPVGLPVVAAAPAGPAASQPSAPSASQGQPPVATQVIPEVTSLMTRGDGTHRIRMRLSPESLGDVSVVMTVRNGSVEVTLGAGGQARDALEQATRELQRMLELAGARSTQIVVRDLSTSATTPFDTTGQAASGHAWGDPERGARRARPDPGTPASTTGAGTSTPTVEPARRSAYHRTSVDVSI